jgi:hypothetical protein
MSGTVSGDCGQQPDRLRACGICENECDENEENNDALEA